MYDDIGNPVTQLVQDIRELALDRAIQGFMEDQVV